MDIIRKRARYLYTHRNYPSLRKVSGLMCEKWQLKQAARCLGIVQMPAPAYAYRSSGPQASTLKAYASFLCIFPIRDADLHRYDSKKRFKVWPIEQTQEEHGRATHHAALTTGDRASPGAITQPGSPQRFNWKNDSGPIVESDKNGSSLKPAANTQSWKLDRHGGSTPESFLDLDLNSQIS